MLQKITKTIFLTCGILSLLLCFCLGILAFSNFFDKDLTNSRQLTADFSRNTPPKFTFQTEIQKVEELYQFDFLPLGDSKLSNELFDNLDFSGDLEKKRYFYVITDTNNFRFVVQSDNRDLEFNFRNPHLKNPPENNSVKSSKIFLQLPTLKTKLGLDKIRMEKEIRELNLLIRKNEILQKLKKEIETRKTLQRIKNPPKIVDPNEPSTPDLSVLNFSDEELLKLYLFDKNNLLDLPFFIQAVPQEYRIYWILPGIGSLIFGFLFFGIMVKLLKFIKT